MSTDEIFWTKVDKSGDCWLWTGAKSRAGYGQLRRSGKTDYAHRISLRLVGRDPGSLTVDHTCHVRSCVNPAHLRLVTSKQNNEHREGANRNSKSGVRGVFFCNTFHKWFGTVTHNRRQYRKSFRTPGEATDWVTAKRLELFTHSDVDRASA